MDLLFGNDRHAVNVRSPSGGIGKADAMNALLEIDIHALLQDSALRVRHGYTHRSFAVYLDVKRALAVGGAGEGKRVLAVGVHLDLAPHKIVRSAVAEEAHHAACSGRSRPWRRPSAPDKR